MNTNHLSDIEIQKFLFQELDSDPEITSHLQKCTECRIKTNQYRHIFEEAGKEKKLVFEFDLTELVMKKLPTGKAKVPFGKSLIYLVLFIALPVTGVLIYLFYSRLSILLSGISQYSIYLIATGMLSLLLIQSVDTYIQYKKKMNALDIY